MAQAANIIKYIRTISATTADYFPIIATIDSVVTDPSDPNYLTCYCVPIDPAFADYQYVRLGANVGSGQSQIGLIAIPKKGSQVLIQPIDGGDAYICMTSEIESIYLNGNDYQGIVIVEKLVDKINNIENLLNDLISKYNAHTHVGTYAISGSNASGTSNPTLSTESSTISPITSTASISSNYVVHGSGQQL